MSADWDATAEGAAAWIASEFYNDEGMAALLAQAELGAAWAEAEAALPEGWCLKLHSDVDVDATDYLAIAQPNTEMPRGVGEWEGGPTPAAALRALAARLREREG